MTTVYEDNLQALERRYRIRPVGRGRDTCCSSPVPPAAAGTPAAAASVDICGDGGGRLRLISARDPEAEAAAWMTRIGLDDRDATVILVGGGLGYIVDVIERRNLPARVVVIEPEPELAGRLLARRDWRAAIDERRLAVIAGPTFDGLVAVAQQMPGVDAASIHVHPVLERAWPTLVREARAAAERLRFEAAANQEARRTLMAGYMRQTLANATRIAREGDAASLVGRFPGLPAIVVAAGPSLDRNIHDLHLVRDRALIVACDTALRPLLSVGIEPDLVVAIDPTVANACHLGALHDPRRTWLAAEGSLHPSAFVHFDARTFFFRVNDHAPWSWLRAAGLDRLHVEVWGSVITAAFDLVLRMGCDPVVFMGADLAFTGGQPYCRGTTMEAQWASWVAGGETYARVFELVRGRWPAVEAPDLHGQATPTASHLVAFRDWLVARAGRACPTLVANASGSGILHGAPIRQAAGADILASRGAIDRDVIQTMFSDAHATGFDRRRLFHAIATLDANAWRWPVEAAPAAAAVDASAIASALSTPDYTAWRLGRDTTP